MFVRKYFSRTTALKFWMIRELKKKKKRGEEKKDPERCHRGTSGMNEIPFDLYLSINLFNNRHDEMN